MRVLEKDAGAGGKTLHLRIQDQRGGTCDGHRGNGAVGKVPPHSMKPRGPRSAAGILPVADAGDVQI